VENFGNDIPTIILKGKRKLACFFEVTTIPSIFENLNNITDAKASNHRGNCSFFRIPFPNLAIKQDRTWQFRPSK
jgi:hypothetical protein